MGFCVISLEDFRPTDKHTSPLAGLQVSTVILTTICHPTDFARAYLRKYVYPTLSYLISSVPSHCIEKEVTHSCYHLPWSPRQPHSSSMSFVQKKVTNSLLAWDFLTLAWKVPHPRNPLGPRQSSSQSSEDMLMNGLEGKRETKGLPKLWPEAWWGRLTALRTPGRNQSICPHSNTQGGLRAFASPFPGAAPRKP